MSPPVGGGCPRGSRRGVPGGSRGGPGGAPGGPPGGAPGGAPGAGPELAGGPGGPGGPRGASGGGLPPKPRFWPFWGVFGLPRRHLLMEKGGSGGSRGVPLGGCPGGVYPGGAKKPEKSGCPILSRLGELLNTLENVHPPGPGGPPGAPPDPTSPRGCPPRPPEYTRGGSVSRPHPVGSVSDPLTLGPLALRVSPGGSSQTPMPPAMGPLAPPS